MSRKKSKNSPPPPNGSGTPKTPAKESTPRVLSTLETPGDEDSEEYFVSDEQDFSQRPAEAEPAHHPPGDDDDSDDERDDENYAVRRGR